ncbi:hypothetical protein N431DRAFT_505780 [Stipitochalara longipes BDJ]|nr:hypothetical protein N431DRAFT_505780 [Stipitochalara longipes BDJ]
MAEALGVAGSVAQGVNFLYDFFSSVQDAPSDIVSLAQELKILGTMLNDVGRDGIESAPLTAALQHCKGIIGDLEDLVEKSNLTSEQSKARKLWSQMSTAFRREKFRKYVEKLERAKSTLLHAKLYAHGSLHQQQMNGIKTIQESLNRIASEHSEAITKTNQTATQMQADIQNVPSRVKQVVINELSSTMAKSHTTCSTILTEVRANSIKADQTSEEIKLAIQSLLSDSNTNRIAALLQPALEKVISDQIASSMETLTAHLAPSRPDMPNRTPFPNVDTSQRAIPESIESKIGLRSLNQYSGTTTCIRWVGTSKVINFWFGRLILSTSVLDSWEGRGIGETHRKAEFLETRATLVPSKWLFRKGVVLKITRLVSTIVAPSIQFSLTPIMVIPEDNEIVFAMQYGDLERVRQLILGGKVHPSSIFPDSSTLVHKCTSEMRRQILVSLVERYRYDAVGRRIKVVNPGYDEGESIPEFAKTIYKIIEIALWLVECGSSAETLNIHRELRAFSALNDMYAYGASVSCLGYGFPEMLESLAIAMLRTSNSSPFFVRNQEGGNLKPTETLVPQWFRYFPFRYFPMIVRGSSADISTPVWLAGDYLESERCLHMLYCSIRGGLVHASPYRPSIPSVYEMGSLEIAKKNRNNIINAIAEMLRYDRDISSDEEREPLVTYAIEWRCLDIWKLALEKAECQPLFSTIWNNYSHLYDPLGFNKCTRDPELEDLTNGWPCVLGRPRIHCEVYPSRAVETDPVDGETNHSPFTSRAKSSSKYKLQPTEDGGIELVIECCEIGEPWRRIYAKVKREQGLDIYGSVSLEDSDSQPSEDGYSDSELNEDEESAEVSTGLFSKVAGVGLDVLSALV